MLAQGIEPSDQVAADDWIRDFNARPEEEWRKCSLDPDYVT
jgi:hypothetical protein